MKQSRIESYISKAKDFFEKNEYSNALQMIDKALFLEPENEKANYFKGLIFIRKNLYRDSLASLRIVSEKTTDFLVRNQVNLLIGYIYDSLGNIKSAINYFEKVLSEGFESSQTYNALGALYYKSGEPVKAVKHVKKALELKKDNYNAMNTMGYILVDSEADIDKGIRFIKKALENDMDNPARLDSMGWAYFKKREYSLAQTFLKKALDLAPEESCIQEHLRFVSSKMGQH